MTAAHAATGLIDRQWPEIMTVAEAAAYSRRSKRTIIIALGEFVRSKGKRGLRGQQPAPNCKWTIVKDDLIAWMEGVRPGRRRTLRSVG